MLSFSLRPISSFRKVGVFFSRFRLYMKFIIQSKMNPQLRKLHFRKLKTQQRTFNNAQLWSKLQNWDIFVEIVSNNAGSVTMILMQVLTFTKKENFIHLFSSSLQSGRNVTYQLTLTYSLTAVVSFETIFFFFFFFFSRIVILRKWSGTRFSFTLA